MFDYKDIIKPMEITHNFKRIEQHNTNIITYNVCLINLNVSVVRSNDSMS